MAASAPRKQELPEIQPASLEEWHEQRELVPFWLDPVWIINCLAGSWSPEACKTQRQRSTRRGRGGVVHEGALGEGLEKQRTLEQASKRAGRARDVK
jgi:hypothetical protein